MKELYKCPFARNRVVSRALRTIEYYEMIKKGDSILISVSGGPDSVFLTHLLYLMRPILDLTLFGYSLDHMTRNGGSAKDAQFVEGLYGELDIKLFKQKKDAAKWSRSHKLSFQEGARNLRIEELLEISEKKNISKIATGHNADDNIETFFINLLRGTGSRGLSGIRPVSGKFIRPLIDIPGKDIISYLDNKRIPYCLDRTNLENIYFRNRIRNLLMPFLSKHFRVSFKSNILRSISILKDEDEFLRHHSAAKMKRMAHVEVNGSEKGSDKYTSLIKIPVSGIQKEAIALRRRIILSAIEKVNGGLEDVSFDNVDDALGICVPGGESKIIQIDKNIRVFKIGNYIYFANTSHAELLSEFKQFLKENEKEIDKRAKGKEVKIGTRMKIKDFNLELSSEILKLKKDKLDFNKAQNTEAFLDYDRIKTPIKVRNWKNGDKFYPQGMKNEKKLQDFFIDNKIPIHLRKSIPVFTDREKIIWIGRYRIDERVKITRDTGKVLHLKLCKK
ncbi:MAG: tRNA lysidine(34) synthetase TilS [Actinomycetota bacterium]|nr:tRNA lysidine(34) synthetase TilS [Actinomycetota bacterium]